jgi:uncharacterized membrane protein YkvA (DUF1232 family)
MVDEVKRKFPDYFEQRLQAMDTEEMGAMEQLDMWQRAATLYFVMADPRTPDSAKAVIASALLYTMDEDDLVPDSLKGGYIDDSGALQAAWDMVSPMVMPIHLHQVQRWEQRRQMVLPTSPERKLAPQLMYTWLTGVKGEDIHEARQDIIEASPDYDALKAIIKKFKLSPEKWEAMKITVSDPRIRDILLLNWLKNNFKHIAPDESPAINTVMDDYLLRWEIHREDPLRLWEDEAPNEVFIDPEERDKLLFSAWIELLLGEAPHLQNDLGDMVMHYAQIWGSGRDPILTLYR